MTMAPGGSSCKEVVESHPSTSDYDIATSKAEINATPGKEIVSLSGKHGVYSNNGVHELLECPVCASLMYPLIHQVFKCIGRHFCLHFEAFQIGVAPLFMAFLRFMGDDNEAKKFSYSLEVGGNGRKIIWHGIPRSSRDSQESS